MKRLAVIFLVLLQVGFPWLARSSVPFSLTAIALPPGFQISLFAQNIPNARSMASGEGGILFVGSRKAGRVYALVDRNGDFKADETMVLAEGLNMPNGVAFRNGHLYVAEVHRVIRFGPDKKLYVPVGAPCNVCWENDRRFATIMRMNADGSGLEVFAEGVRNSVGFDWHPQTRELWFTDNGRDWLGDDFPPDELNQAPTAGRHFGFPYVHGNNVPDPVFRDQAPRREFNPPARELAPHVAALGMRFYSGEMFPPEYRGQIFIAEHGSWNRSQPIGYRITRVRLKMVDPHPTTFLPAGGSGMAESSVGRWIWRSSKTVPCWSRTTMPAESTEYPTSPDPGRWVLAFLNGGLTPWRTLPP